jgi:hypothetical protein
MVKILEKLLKDFLTENGCHNYLQKIFSIIQLEPNFNKS